MQSRHRFLAFAALCTLPLAAQSEVRGFGFTAFTLRTPPPPAIDVAATSGGHALVVHADGSATAFGRGSVGQCSVPPLPPGLTYVQGSGSSSYSLLRRSDGQIVGFGAAPVAPPLPPGTTYTWVGSHGGSFALPHNYAFRSDGEVVAWGDNHYGQCNTPPLPPGVTWVQIALGVGFTMGLRSDGTAVGWGYNFYNQCDLPALPPGTTYVKVAAGALHALGLRSDGQIVGTGASSFGQITVPALPPGTTYTHVVAGGSGSIAMRSDGAAVPFGTIPPSMPTLPPSGTSWAEFEIGSDFVIARRSDGTVAVWPPQALPWSPHSAAFSGIAAGNQQIAFLHENGAMHLAGSYAVPPLPPGLGWRDATFGAQHSLLLRSDGAAFGLGQSNDPAILIPWLPPTLQWAALAAGDRHSLGLTSNGLVLAWGSNQYGQCDVPGLSQPCIQVAAGGSHSLLLLADGSIVGFGFNGSQQCVAPPLPPGIVWVQIAAGKWHSIGRRSDGQVMVWGDSISGVMNIPALPPGQVFVDIAQGSSADHALAIRSDGTPVVWGRYHPESTAVGVLPPNLAAVEVAVGESTSVVRYGAPRSYVRSGLGCAGSQAATTLVPLDLPRLGTTFTIALDHLPGDLAFLFTGFSNTTSRFGPLPLALGALGMPNCTAYTSDEVTTFVLGSSGRARAVLGLPNDAAFLGLVFHQQALVLDPQAGNSLGAVMSDAATAQIGR
jgi:alpha-tubulin suppressor-like RCC1 family protein